VRAAAQRMISWDPEQSLIAQRRFYRTQAVDELRRAFRWSCSDRTFQASSVDSHTSTTHRDWPMWAGKDDSYPAGKWAAYCTITSFIAPVPTPSQRQVPDAGDEPISTLRSLGCPSTIYRQNGAGD
jgi:hypothetical protein